MFSDAPDESVILRVAFVSCEYGEQGNVDKYVNREQFTDGYSMIEYFRVTKYIVVGMQWFGEVINCRSFYIFRAIRAQSVYV